MQRGLSAVLVLVVLLTAGSHVSAVAQDDGAAATTTALETRVAGLATAVAALQAQVAEPASLPASATATVATVEPGVDETPEAAPAATGDQGTTRDHPVPLNTSATVADWTIMVTDVTPDATDAILTANQFNAPPQSGRQFYVVSVEITYTGPGSKRVSSELSFSAVGDTNVSYSTYDPSCGVIPNELPSSEVFTDGTVKGDICFQAKTEDVDSLVLYAGHLFSADDDRVYFALQADNAATEEDGRQTAASTVTSATEQDTATEPIALTMVDIAFDPKRFSVPAESNVALTLTNDGALPHNFSVDALGIDVDVAAGANGEATITGAAGTYEYYCDIPGHKEAGMVGTLIVE
jgi:uncharacterized cupredoxin-like copper-binding protein